MNFDVGSGSSFVQPARTHEQAPPGREANKSFLESTVVVPTRLWLGKGKRGLVWSWRTWSGRGLSSILADIERLQHHEPCLDDFVGTSQIRFWVIATMCGHDHVAPNEGETCMSRHSCV
jgi:hypothetical protein